MKVIKFGGSSVGTPEMMMQVAKIIAKNDKQIIVLSAVQGTTNSLNKYIELLESHQNKEALHWLLTIENEHIEFSQQLINDAQIRLDLEKKIHSITQNIKPANEIIINKKRILAIGEQLSTEIFHHYLLSIQQGSSLISALSFMRKDENDEPDHAFILENINKVLLQLNDCNCFITQGFICKNKNGEIDNFERGGSDYTATLLGAAVNAEEVQIWTDIDGVHNNDPRFVSNTFPVRELSYNEAAELAYFGAKILHPTCVFPVIEKKIPIRLKNTKQPDAKGTIIHQQTSNKNIKAIAAKDNITAIKIRSSRMLNAYGFLRQVFEIFEKYRIPIDMITTSEVAVSVTIEQTENLSNLLAELQTYGEVEFDKNQTIICIVGDFLASNHGYASRIFTNLRHLPIRMVSYGGSKNNVSILIHTDDKINALESLNKGLFQGLH